MIHRSVVCSDEYTELSYEAQALYIQLTIEADSFGFVGGIKKIMRSIGVGPDALEELVKARFVLRFDSGVFVIRHWMVGNGAFKNDRGYEAKYPKELAQLFVDYDLTYVIEVNLSSSVQSRNTQNDERKRFLEPEVVALIRTAPRQPPLQRHGLGGLSGKCYTGRTTGLAEACLIPIAVGGPATAFSRRSVKTGGNRNVSPGSMPSLSGSSIVHAA